MARPGQEDATERAAVVELHELRHELGNALAAVTSYAQVLLRRLPAWADARDREALVAIQNGLLRARDLLRPAPAGFPATRCDVHTLVALAISQVPPERIPDLVVNFRTEMPLIGFGHPERIVQVLANLLDNAVKYSVPGTPIEVETSWIGDSGREWVLIVVRDRGIGLESDAIEVVFSGYRAAPWAAPGFGLGLPLCRRLVEAEGGQLWVTSRPGRGSSFYTKLPLARIGAEERARGDSWQAPGHIPEAGATVPCTSRTQHTADNGAVAGARGADAPRWR